MVSLLKTLFASLMGGKGSIVNNIGGAANHVALAACVTWVLANPDEVVTFSLTRITLLAVAAIAYLFLEVLRRSKPSTHRTED